MKMLASARQPVPVRRISEPCHDGMPRGRHYRLEVAREAMRTFPFGVTIIVILTGGLVALLPKKLANQVIKAVVVDTVLCFHLASASSSKVGTRSSALLRMKLSGLY